MTKALLLAAGLGTRLRPITKTCPKCLVPIGGRPLLSYWLDNLAKADIKTALINTHYLAQEVDDYLSKQVSELQILQSYEPDLLGSAGTIHNNSQFAKDTESIVIIYTDNLSDVAISDLVSHHNSHTLPFTMMLFHSPNPSSCGIATLDHDQRIIDFIEKPEHPTSDLANAGVYVVDSALYDEIAKKNAFDLGHDVLPNLTGRMHGFVHEGYHRDIGNLESLKQAESDLRAGELLLHKNTPN